MTKDICSVRSLRELCDRYQASSPILSNNIYRDLLHLKFYLRSYCLPVQLTHFGYASQDNDDKARGGVLEDTF